jgi:hypothetical protein
MLGRSVLKLRKMQILRMLQFEGILNLRAKLGFGAYAFHELFS